MLQINESVTLKTNNPIATGLYLHYDSLSVNRVNKGTASKALTAVDTVNKKFTATGDITDKLAIGAKIDIAGSTSNDGTYTVVSAVLVSGNTEITVEEAIPDGTVNGNCEYKDLVYKLYAVVLGFESEKFANECVCNSQLSVKLPDGAATKEIKHTYNYELTQAEFDTGNMKDLADTKIKADLETAGYTAANVVIK